MGDMGEIFNAMKQESKERRERNRNSSAALLEEKGIRFESKNGGAHLIVTGKNCLIDFWPGTGKYIARNGKRGRGVHNLMRMCK